MRAVQIEVLEFDRQVSNGLERDEIVPADVAINENAFLFVCGIVPGCIEFLRKHFKGDCIQLVNYRGFDIFDGTVLSWRSSSFKLFKDLILLFQT